MTYRIVILRRAQFDIDSILHWIAIERNAPEGAARWIDALEAALATVELRPFVCAVALENDHVRYELRQFLFKTPRGRTYRGVFTVVDEEIRVLRIRGPGQAPLGPDEIGD